MVMPYVIAGSQNPGQRELDFCIHYRYETQKAILSDLVASLYAQGYRKMVIINGHGGNTFKSICARSKISCATSIGSALL